MTKKTENRSPPQSEKFLEAARSLGCDEDPAHFDEALKKVARHKPRAEAPPVPPKSRSAASKEPK
jgi:hypothetical protein